MKQGDPEEGVDAITHLLVGRLLAAPLPGPLGVLATVFAVLPDIDTLVWAFPRLSRFVRHRTWTHSLLVGAGASAAAGALFALMGWSSFGFAFAVAFGGFLSHVALDVLNGGCFLLWPWRPRRVAFTVHHDFRSSIPLAALGLAILEAARLLAPQLHAPVAALLGALLAIYFGGRVARRLLLARREGDDAVPARG